MLPILQLQIVGLKMLVIRLMFLILPGRKLWQLIKHDCTAQLVMKGACLRAGILTVKSGTIVGNSPNSQLIHVAHLPIEIENPRAISPTIHKKQNSPSNGCRWAMNVNGRQLV